MGNVTAFGAWTHEMMTAEYKLQPQNLYIFALSGILRSMGGRAFHRWVILFK